MPKSTKGQLPSKMYRYLLYIGTDADGKRKYKSFTAESLAKAKKDAQIWKQDHPSKPSKDPTFHEAAERFMINRSSTLSDSTQRDYLNRINYICRLFPIFARTRLSMIGSEDVQMIVNELARTRKPCKKKNAMLSDIESMPYMSNKSIMSYYSLISIILRTQGNIVLHDIKLPTVIKKELQIPEEDEIKKLLQHIKGTELEIPVLLAALGPMRRSEIYGLDIEKDIDYENHTVRIHRVYIVDRETGYTYKETPKSAAGYRVITYPAYVTDLIKERGHITTFAINYITKKFQLEMMNVGLPKYRFHDLRHYSASFQIALGVPPQYVMDRGGWETDQTMKRYIHALNQKRKEFSDKTNAAFEGLLS